MMQVNGGRSATQPGHSTTGVSDQTPGCGGGGGYGGGDGPDGTV